MFVEEVTWANERNSLRIDGGKLTVEYILVRRTSTGDEIIGKKMTASGSASIRSCSEMTCPFATPTYDRAKGVVSKCHLCAHRVDAGRLPACVAACPTEALRYVAAAEPDARPEGPSDVVPGFADPAGCRPALRFLAPAGARRAELFRSLEEALRR